MKKTIHPKFGDTKIITTNQVELVVKSAMSILNQNYHLSVDPLNHPAWTGKKRQSILSDNSSRLKKNFSGIEDL